MVSAGLGGVHRCTSAPKEGLSLDPASARHLSPLLLRPVYSPRLITAFLDGEDAEADRGVDLRPR
jgi:hypothetical protein